MDKDWELFDGEKIEGPFAEKILLESIAKGLSPSIVVRQVGTDKWEPLSAHAQFALAAERAKAKADAAKPKTSARRRTLVPLGAAALLLAFLVANTFWLGLGTFVEASCNTTGSGDATCLFTNRGFMPSSGCWIMAIRRAGDSEGIRSVPLCSGIVWPMSSSSAASRLAFVEQSPGPYCIGRTSFREMDGRSWSDFCAIAVQPAP